MLAKFSRRIDSDELPFERRRIDEILKNTTKQNSLHKFNGFLLIVLRFSIGFSSFNIGGVIEFSLELDVDDDCTSACFGGKFDCGRVGCFGTGASESDSSELDKYFIFEGFRLGVEQQMYVHQRFTFIAQC